MATSNSILAYSDLREACDRALAAEKGIRIYESSFGRLIHLRQRLNKFKMIHRNLSRKQYDAGDPQYGTTPYDELAVLTNTTVAGLKKDESGNWPEVPKEELYLEVVRRTPANLKVEEIL